MIDRNILQPEIDMIKDEQIKGWVTRVIKEKVEDKFFIIPASSTGKYHPQCTNREGGLIVHTKRVVYIADRLSFSWNIKDLNRDIVIAACILHDISKCGKDSGAYIDYVNHPILASNMFFKSFEGQELGTSTEIVETISNCIKYHMGLWTPDSIKKPLGKYNTLELAVYTSDYIASTKEMTTPVDGYYVVKGDN